MAGYTFAQLRTKLNTRLNDTGNTIWDSTTKDEFMNEAFDDPFVYVIDRDQSTETVLNQVEYPVPSQLDDAIAIGIDFNSDGSTHYLGPDAFDTLSDTIIFDPFYYGAIPGGLVMTVVGPRHLQTADTVPAFLAEYVLELAIVAAFKWLTSELGSLFLTNDMTMSELTQKINTHQNRVSELRRTLTNRRIVRF